MRKQRSDRLAGSLLLLFLLVALNRLASGLGSADGGPLPLSEKVFVRLSGDIPCPGVYGFSSPPGLDRLIAAGGGSSPPEVFASKRVQDFDSGAWIHVKKKENRLDIIEKTMPAFHRFTLGIPLRVNCETREALTAIPGIGPKTADAIVSQREKTGEFQKLDHLLSVPGFGPATLEKIRPHVELSCCREETAGPRGSRTERE